MPSFEVLILGAPVGFIDGCCRINELASISPNVLDNLIFKSAADPNFSPSNPSEALQSKTIKTINYIVRSFKTANPPIDAPRASATLSASTILTKEIIDKFITELQSSPHENYIPTLSKVSSKLCNFEWNVGVAMSSSKCRNLSHPYVFIKYDLKKSDGVITRHSAELTYEQFKDFKSNFEKVALVMDGL